MADRYVVIVPRSSPETFAYLSESFRSLPEVEIVLDRRAAAPEVRHLLERRGDKPRFENDAFGCRLIRVERSIPADAKASNSAPVAPLRAGTGASSRPRLRSVSGLRDS